MADSSPLGDLLNCAERIFSLAGELGQAFHEQGQSQEIVVDPATWRHHEPLFNQFIAAVLDQLDAIQDPPEGFLPVARPLRAAARIAKEIRDALARDAGGFTKYSRFSPGLCEVSTDGLDVVDQVRRNAKPHDPLAFVDQEPRRPVGWEGTLPGAGVETVGLLRKYLEFRLAKLRIFGDRPNGSLSDAVRPDFTHRYYIQGREALRNALRGFDHLGLSARPNPWPGDFDGISHHELERRLSELVRYLTHYVERTAAVFVKSEAKLPSSKSGVGQGQPTDPAGEPASDSPTGFLGGAALADALGILATRRDAFFRQLERQRTSLGENCWHEVCDARPNSPRFLYRADSPKLRNFAAAYKKPKPA